MAPSNDSKGAQQHDDLLEKMDATRKKWASEDDGDEQDDTDELLQQAIDMAVNLGKGWAPGEKEEYMARILDDDFIPPMFCETEEELEKTGLAEAFSALQYDDDPAITMQECKQKGADAFVNAKRNQANNIQYYRDAVNHYYEAIAWAQKIESLENIEATKKQSTESAGDDTTAPDAPNKKPEVEYQKFAEKELDELKSTLYSNAALCHLQLKNWGHVKTDSEKALAHNPHNVKALYRNAKAHQMLQEWEEAGESIDKGLAVDASNKDLLKLQKLLQDKIRKARLARQKRERIRAERVSQVKQVWKHCQSGGGDDDDNDSTNDDGKKIQLGRVALVASVSDDDDYDDGVDSAEARESRWHHHFPHTGVMPSRLPDTGVWAWPALFLYPSHSQSDFVKHFGEDEMLAMRMADMFPELEKGEESVMPWDYNNEFQCSKLAVYFEVNCPDDNNGGNNKSKTKTLVVHPDNVERLTDQAATMRFYEASRALKGDEGPEMANLAKAVERKRLYKQRKAWKKKHGSLWAKPDPCPVVRVHPAMTLRDVLTDSRMVVANFVVTLVVIPEEHPAHADYLKEHRCLGILQPEENA
ncbi:MAG: hypothetical protein SGILL_005680 [Bacillariaceae sp.]